MNTLRTLGLSLLLGLLLPATVGGALPETLSIQGILRDPAGEPVADGEHVVRFALYESALGETPVWAETQVVVTESGLFGALLGPSTPLSIPFDTPYFLGLTLGDDVEMQPRIPLTASAYAFMARSVQDSSITAGKIASGTVVTALNGLTDAVNLAEGENIVITQDGNTLTINAPGSPTHDNSHDPSASEKAALAGTAGTPSESNRYVTDEDPRLVSEGTVDSTAWHLGGNTIVDPTTQFIGTTNDSPFAVHVNGSRALRIETGARVGTEGVNMLGGSDNNLIEAGVIGAVISGGGNRSGIQLEPNRALSDFATIAGGANNSAGLPDGNPSDGSYATIGGGHNNTVQGWGSTIAGGDGNQATGTYVAIAGGTGHQATAFGAMILGGNENQVHAPYGLAAGVRAQVAPGDSGTFVWSDDRDEDFISTGAGQFLIRARGGMGINTNAPQAAVHIGGSPGVDGLMFPDGTLQTTAASGASGWGLTGNAGTDTTVNFLGTLDSMPLFLRVNQEVAFRLLPGNTADHPNVIGGSSTNRMLTPSGSTTIAGGWGNETGATFATVGGGTSNHAYGGYSVVSGGSGNAATGDGSTVGGGGNNLASGKYATVAGGGPSDEELSDTYNRALDDFSLIGGGGANVAGSDDGNPGNDPFAVVVGGEGNQALKGHSVVVGGQNNQTQSRSSVICGGSDNVINGTAVGGFLGGGQSNEVQGLYSVIAGGWFNTNPGIYNFVGGGVRNVVGSGHSVVVGGAQNRVWGAYSSILGGGSTSLGDTMSVLGARGVILGGRANVVEKDYGMILGGRNNRTVGTYGIAAGENNRAGDYSVALGGANNEALGAFSWAGGSRAKATHFRSFVWGSSTTADFSSTASNQFLVSASGGMGVGTNLTPEALNILEPSGGTAVHIGGSGSAGPNGVIFEDDTDAAGVQLFFRTGPNQLVLEKTSAGTGTDGTDVFNYDRDTDDFQFNTDLGVAGSVSGTATFANHVVRLENTSTTTNADAVAIRINTLTPGSANNFISFFGSGGTAVGAIEGDGAGSISYAGAGADYAEWLPRVDPSEVIRPGDVVGVHGGKISRRTTGANQIMVISSAPLVVGNTPHGGDTDPWNKVAFIGQVDVRVRGSVSSGDCLLASGLDDGWAVAVPAHQMTPVLWTRFLGVAWDSQAADGGETVRAAVGLTAAGQIAANQAGELMRRDQRIEDLEQRMADLERRLSDLVSR